MPRLIWAPTLRQNEASSLFVAAVGELGHRDRIEWLIVPVTHGNPARLLEEAQGEIGRMTRSVGHLGELRLIQPDPPHSAGLDPVGAGV